MQKFLFSFGYIGTRFSGLTKGKVAIQNSIHYYIQEALEKILQKYGTPVPALTFSSRTDAGVHAICSTFDCEFPSSFPMKNIVLEMNFYFQTSDLDIRIHKFQAVPSHFKARFSASRRSYLYRLAHAPLIKQLPMCEVDRCQLVTGKLDIEAIEEACTILKGSHDFSYYTSSKGKMRRTVRTLNELKIVPGTPLFDPEFDDHYEGFNFWDVFISQKGFLHNQVRRKVAILIAVGQGRKTLHDVRNTLLNPNQLWDPSIMLASPHGLYLLKVEYPPESFQEQQIAEEVIGEEDDE